LKPLGARHGAALLGEILRPLAPPAELLDGAVRRAKGVPSSLLAIGTALRREWRERGVIPETARIPAVGRGIAALETHPGPGGSSLGDGERRVLEALAALGRAASRSDARGTRRDREPERPSSDLLARPLGERRKELERDYLARLFVELGGDMGRMMEKLEVRSTKLYEWMRDLGLDIRELRKRLRK